MSNMTSADLRDTEIVKVQLLQILHMLKLVPRLSFLVSIFAVLRLDS
jgi:hypothetical protein